MSWVHANSSHECGPPTTSRQHYDDSALDGVAAHIKLLLKLVHDHRAACDKEKNDRRRMLRVATMMTILDTVKTRIQKCQSFGNKRAEAELRRCNTDLRVNHGPRERRHGSEMVADEKEKLRRELSASLAARKSLEIMCSSLGKEREIMATELSRKVQELSGMEELINDLKAHNETLREKVQECALEHKGESQGDVALLEQNKVLSEQLLRSLDGYRLMRTKLKEVQEENVMMRSRIDEMGVKVETSLDRVRSIKECMSFGSDGNPPVDAQEEIVALEKMFECFKMMVAKHDQKQGECLELRSNINECKACVVALEEKVT